MSVPGPVWVLSPHLLVAQAVTAALRSVGVPAETRRWESVVDDDGSPVLVASRPAVVVAIVDGVDNSAVVGHVEALAQPGDARVVVVSSPDTSTRWGGLLSNDAVDVVTVTTSVSQLAEVVQRLTAGTSSMDPEERAALRTSWAMDPASTKIMSAPASLNCCALSRAASKPCPAGASMRGKIMAAVDARTDADMLVMARTDAAAVHGFEAAIERAQQFSEAGADILFVEAVTLADEVRALPRRLGKPQLMNMVIGGKTPTFGAEELGALGYGLVLYANAALQGAVAGMQRALTVLRDTRRLDEDPSLVVSFAERQRLVGKPGLDELEKKYAE